MAIDNILPSFTDFISALPPNIIEKIGGLITVLKAVGIAVIVYVIYAVTMGILNFYKMKRMKYIEEKIAEKVGLVKIIDASSFEFAQIAMGDAELYLLQNVLHDVAAGVVIINEAGGKVTDYRGDKWSPNSKYIVASNKRIHKEVINVLK